MNNRFNLFLFLSIWMLLFGILWSLVESSNPTWGASFEESNEVSQTTEAPEIVRVFNNPIQQSTGVVYTMTMEELQTLAKVVYREARGIPQKSHQAAVIWCILNRVDDGYWGDDIISVATYPNAFAWVPDTPVDEELMSLVVDVVTRWNWEKQGLENVGRVLPSTYLYFTGDGEFNYFTEKWGSSDYWDWSLSDPYSS